MHLRQSVVAMLVVQAVVQLLHLHAGQLVELQEEEVAVAQLLEVVQLVVPPAMKTVATTTVLAVPVAHGGGRSKRTGASEVGVQPVIVVAG